MIYLLILIFILIIFYEHRKHKYLIENGNIIFKNLTETYNLESLMKDLIKRRVTNIESIDKAYYLFGFLKVASNKPYVLISNGKIDYEALLKSKKSPYFIYKVLNEKALKLEEVLYAIYLDGKFYIVKV